MKQVLVLGIRDEKARMKVTPPLAVAPIAQEDGICGWPDVSERLSIGLHEYPTLDECRGYI